MISKFGSVTIKEDSISIDGFTFEWGDVVIDTLEWAKERIDKELERVGKGIYKIENNTVLRIDNNKSEAI